MSQARGKGHLGELPSPVEGMNLGHWLGRARITEDQLVALLGRSDLSLPQQAKVQGLLRRLRDDISVQLKKTP
jgi:hypothetical protein